MAKRNIRQKSTNAQTILRHFSTTNQGNQMTKTLTKAQQIRSYVAANPNAKPKDVAKTLGVGLQYVYSVMWTAKKKAAKKRITITATQAMLAKKAGIPLVEYAKSLMEAQKKKVGRPRKVVEAVTALKPIAPYTPMQIEMFEPTPDPVNHPAHYKVGGIETIDFIEAKKLGYNLGNVVKYLTRADHKGNRKQDLEKALWYLNREINSLK
jgi:hypothetical protein